MRILICEDDPCQTMVLEMIFEEAGHEIAGIFSRADAAVLHCWKQPPDLAVVDLNLADGPTGPSLLHVLDKLGVPSIVVTGQAEILAALPPTVSVIRKPYRAHQLLDALATTWAT